LSWRSHRGSQVFFQRYFAQKHEKEQKRTAKVDKRKAKFHGSDGESEQDGSSDGDSDLEEAVIWKVGSLKMMRIWLMRLLKGNESFNAGGRRRL